MKHRLLDWAATACIVLSLYFGTIAVLQVSGCEVFGAAPSPVVQSGFDEAQALIEAAKQERLRLAAKPDKTPDEIAALAKAEAQIAKLEELLTEVRASYEEGGGLRVVTDFIPPPWNVPASLVFGSFGTWWKGRKGRKSFQALVEGLNAAKASDMTFANALKKVKPTLEAHMGPKATAVVRAGRKEGRFPVV